MTRAGAGSAPFAVLEDQPIDGPGGTWSRRTVAVPHVDVAGARRTARAHLYVPPSVLRGDVERAALLHVAGYEIGSGVGALLLPWWMQRQLVIVNPVTPVGDEAWPGENALARGWNLDAALLRMARTLPFVDDARVVVTGQSAGGYTSLMLAATTFPLAGVAPDVCPVDMAFTARHLLERERLASLPGSPVPGRPEVAAVVAQAMSVIGDDLAGSAWWDHSPIGRLDEITAPVSVVMSSADLLVPVSQIARDLVVAHDPALFPAGFTTDPSEVLGCRRPTLVDELGAERVAVHHVGVPEGVPEIRLGTPVPPDRWHRLPIPDADRPWNVTVVDEGPVEPWIDHMRYATLFHRDAFLDRCLDEPVAVSQLTAAKLDVLLDRAAGVERDPRIRRLDDARTERADVVRGLRTYAATSADHAARVVELYAAAAPARQVLGTPDQLASELASD